MQNLRILPVLFLSLIAQNALAAEMNCDPLKPNVPREVTTEANGKIDGTLKRFVNLGGSLEGSYKEASKDILKEYPNADKLYLWDRLIYLNCESLRALRIDDSAKFDRLNQLMDRLGKPPEMPR